MMVDEILFKDEMAKMLCAKKCLVCGPIFLHLCFVFPFALLSPLQTREWSALADGLAQGRLHYVERCPPPAARAHVEEEGRGGGGYGGGNGEGGGGGGRRGSRNAHAVFDLC